MIQVLHCCRTTFLSSVKRVTKPKQGATCHDRPIQLLSSQSYAGGGTPSFSKRWPSSLATCARRATISAAMVDSAAASCGGACACPCALAGDVGCAVLGAALLPVRVLQLRPTLLGLPGFITRGALP